MDDATYKELRSCLAIFQSILELSNNKFDELMNKAAYTDTRNFRRSKKGVPHRMQCQEFVDLMQKGYQEFRADQSIDSQQRQRVEERWKQVGDKFLQSVQDIFAYNELVQQNKEILIQLENKKNLETVKQFISGEYGNAESGLTKEEADCLRECLKSVFSSHKELSKFRKSISNGQT